MNRRHFLRLSALAVPAASLRPRSLFAESVDTAVSRTYEVTTSVRVMNRTGQTRLWLPLPLRDRESFQDVLSSEVHSNGGMTSLHEDRLSGLQILAAVYPADQPAELTMVQRVRTRDWEVPISAAPAPRKFAATGDEKEFLKPTRYVPTDGIVKRTSDEITRGATTDVEKTRAIYEWIVKNTYRKPTVLGCGVGNIKPMLETGDLGGKCADLNGLFVGLARAAGVPARDVYGIRLGASTSECKSLGASSSNVAKSQHCRSEVFLTGFGWVPMDPADVRKAVLEEAPDGLSLTDGKILRLEHRLFGSWEMNWMAYNYAQDVELPGSRGRALPFFMYPQAETDEGRLDSLDPASFHYEITSREVA